MFDRRRLQHRQGDCCSRPSCPLPHQAAAHVTELLTKGIQIVGVRANALSRGRRVRECERMKGREREQTAPANGSPSWGGWCNCTCRPRFICRAEFDLLLICFRFALDMCVAYCTGSTANHLTRFATLPSLPAPLCLAYRTPPHERLLTVICTTIYSSNPKTLFLVDAAAICNIH